MQIIQLRIPDYLFRSIEQACDIRGCLGTEQYMLQLAEADTAEFRVKKIVKEPVAPKGAPPPKNGNATRRSTAGKGATWADAKKRLRPEDVQKLFFIWDTGGCTSVDSLAHRFSCSRSTIRRYLMDRKLLVRVDPHHPDFRGATLA